MLQQFNEKNRDLLVNINGKLLHRDQAGISPFDSAVQGGDAVWEGLRLYSGRIFKLREHLDRLRSSALALAFKGIPSHEQMIGEISRTLEANQMFDGVHIRLTLTRGVKITSGMDPRLNQAGPTLIVLAEHKPPVYDRGGITLITSSMRRFPPDCLDPKIHHCNLIQSILAKIQANQAGADDAVMLDLHGFVAETNATHLFLVHQGEVHTSTCAACHRADGGGVVGPNLTDDFWLHGSAPEKIFRTIATGVPDKGMPAWQPQLGALKTQAVAAYVLTLRGTHAAGGKAPQGERETLSTRE